MDSWTWFLFIVYFAADNEENKSEISAMEINQTVSFVFCFNSHKKLKQNELIRQLVTS